MDNIVDELKNKVRKSIRSYEILLRSSKNLSDTSNIKSTLKSLHSQLRDLESQSKFNEVDNIFRQKLTQAEIKGAKDVFDFYAKQHMMLGKTPTFEQIYKHTNIIDSGSFIQFCRDFAIMPPQGTRGADQRYLTRDDIIAVFNECAYIRRHMEFRHFLDSLEQIAQRYYDPKYESLFKVPLSALDINQKIVMLYEFCGFGNHKLYSKKCRHLTRCFVNSIDSKSRISESDPLHGYKFQLSFNSKIRLDHYKKSKSTLGPDAKSRLGTRAKSRAQAIRSQLVNRRSVNTSLLDRRNNSYQMLEKSRLGSESFLEV